MWMGYSGLISISLNSKINPDLAFFHLILSNESFLVIISILVLALALTLSTIDTLINAITSLIIIDGKKISKSLNGKKIKQKANKLIIFLSAVVFIFASKGFSILYLFLIADLLCCAAAVTVFYGFVNKKINLKLASLSILFGLISGLLFFPDQSFQSSILVGNILSIDMFSEFISSNLLFISFAFSLIVPLIIITIYSFRSSFR